MSESPTLPWFNRPPVQEVALALQFAQPLELAVTDLGVIRSHFVAEYPDLEEHRNAAPISLERPSGIQIEMSDSVDHPRLWFLSNNHDRLVQFQADRLAVNWRREINEDYPRYENAIRPMMERAWHSLLAALDELGQPAPMPHIGEVVYVNPIEAGEGWSVHGEIDRVIAPWSSNSDSFLPRPVDVRIASRYELPNDGQLVVEVTPARNAGTNVPAIMLTLSARGPIQGETFESALEFFDMAREWVVRGFTSITTPEMHLIWERADAH